MRRFLEMSGRAFRPFVFSGVLSLPAGLLGFFSAAFGFAVFAFDSNLVMLRGSTSPLGEPSFSVPPRRGGLSFLQ